MFQKLYSIILIPNFFVQYTMSLPQYKRERRVYIKQNYCLFVLVVLLGSRPMLLSVQLFYVLGNGFFGGVGGGAKSAKSKL